MFCMQVTIAYNKMNEKGTTKEVREQYVVEASTFIDAEQKIRDEMNYNNRPIKVPAIVKPKYGEICFSDDANAENFYKVKVVINEEVEVRTRKGGTRTKTKAVSHYHLVQAASNEDARKAIVDEVYKNTMCDYEIADIMKTRILDVLENDKHLQTLATKNENGEEKLS
jgi:hypothetical protein